MQVFAAKPRFIRDPAFTNATAMALCDRLRDVKRDVFESALWVGAGDAALLKDFKTIGHLEQRDFPVEGAIEHFPYPEHRFDLIVVNGTLHTVSDLPGALVQMRRALKPDGLFIAVLTGGETLFELRDSLTRVETAIKGGAGARVHPMVDLQTMAGLMQRAGFALPVVDAERKQVFYQKLSVLLRDIKKSGEGIKLLARAPYTGKNFWKAVETDYKKHHADRDGLLKMTIEIIHAIGWAPADTQQQPLRPGSAKHRLADALGSAEITLPDRAKPH